MAIKITELSTYLDKYKVLIWIVNALMSFSVKNSLGLDSFVIFLSVCSRRFVISQSEGQNL